MSSSNNNNHYLVTWVIDMYTDTPLEAAQQARELQLDPKNTADVFRVLNVKTGEEIQLGATDGNIYPLE